MGTFRQDLRYAVRMLLKKPGFTVVAVLTLALGIGANTAIFSIVNAVLLRSLPYPEPDRLVQVWETFRPQDVMVTSISPHNFADWQRENQSFEQLASYSYTTFTLTVDDQPEPVRGLRVSADFLSVMGVRPDVGRDFLREEDAPGKNRVLILSHALWQRRFAGDEQIVGQTIPVNGETFTVIGVMPRGFAFPDSIDLWTPLGLDMNRIERGTSFLFGVGRLKKQVTIETAQAEMSAIAASLEQLYPNTNTGCGVNLVALHDQLVGDVKLRLWVLFGAVGFVLLIACVNVANLLIARAVTRHKEIAIRIALGGSRWRLIRQFLTESALLSVIGGGAGLLLAMWGVDFLVAASPVQLPHAGEIGVDGWALAFTALASLATGLVFGIVPALQATRPDVQETLKETGQSVTAGIARNRLRKTLVVAEIALALILLACAGLLINSFLRLQRVPTGFDPKNVLTMRISLPRSRYAEPHRQAAFFEQVLQKISALEGARSVGATNDLPFSGSRSHTSFSIEGRPSAAPGESPNSDFRTVSPDYFNTLGIQLLRGRSFTERDTKDSPAVVVINEEMARRYFADEDPIGRRIQIGNPEEIRRHGKALSREIIGIIRDVKHWELKERGEAELYTPLTQMPDSTMFLAVRGDERVANLVGAIRDAVRTLDPHQAVSNIRLMEERLSYSIATERINTVILGFFAVVALLLAALGIYGVMSHAVTQRTHEIGVRMALGAERRDIFRLVVGQGLTLAVIGVALGLAASLALMRFLSTLLFGVEATDPLTYTGVSLILLVVAMLACYLPARRATRVDPMIALRYE
ncbi:MAG: ABC transporter permease [Acidobacteriota bacterium]